MGDLRPIHFNSTNLEYEQSSIRALIELINVRKLINEFTQLLLYYPVRELFSVVGFISKFYGFTDRSGEELNTLKKIIKSFYNITNALFASNDHDYLHFQQRYQKEFLLQNN